MTAMVNMISSIPTYHLVVDKIECKVEEDSQLWLVRRKTQYREGMDTASDAISPLSMCCAIKRGR